MRRQLPRTGRLRCRRSRSEIVGTNTSLRRIHIRPRKVPRYYAYGAASSRFASSSSTTSGSSSESVVKKEGDDDEGEEAKIFGVQRSIVKHVGILAASQFMLNLGFSQMVPIIPLFAAKMGGHLGATGVGLILSAPSAATLLLNVPLGRLCDTIGRKPLMWVGTALTAVGTTATGFASSVTMLLPCRLLVGAGSAASMTGSSAYMADISDKAPEHRAKIMGVHQAIVGSVWVVGPAVGGYLAEAYGYRNSFLIAGVCAAVCSLGYTQLPETLRRPKLSPEPEAQAASDASAAASATASPPVAEKKKLTQHVNEWFAEVKSILADSNQQALIALACELPIRFSCFTTAVALHASNVAGAGPKELGLIFTALALSQGLGMPFGSWLADKMSGPRKMLVLPTGLLSSAFFCSLAFSTSHSQILAAMAVQGFCGGFYRPAIGAFTAEVTPANQRGQALSLQRQAGSFLSLIGPVSMGLIADMTSCPTAIMIGSGLMAACHVSYAMLATKSLAAGGTAPSSTDVKREENLNDGKAE